MRTRKRDCTTKNPPSSVDTHPVAMQSSSFLSTGSTLLNLACSDKVDGGFVVGRLTHIVGDSSSGKTFLALTILAECTLRKRFENYKLIYDDAEAASSFNISKLFGKRLEKRLQEPPRGISDTIQDFVLNVKELLDKDTPFIYVLDSFDALTSDEDFEKLEELKKAKDKGTRVKGSYGMQKPKMSSQMLRSIVSKLSMSSSAIIILSQTRDNINPLTFATKTYSGGRALKFYATHQVWLAVGGKHKKNGMTIGIDVVAKLTKNKTTGKVRQVRFPIYYSYGIDDVQSCILFLLDVGVGKKQANKIIIPPLYNKPLTLHKLINHIETTGKISKLRNLTTETWLDIEKNLVFNRPGKYE